MPLAFGATGCVSAITNVPSQGGPAWHRVTSPHFVVDSNVDTGSAETVVRELELLHDALRAAPWVGHEVLSEPLHVIALRTQREAEVYAGTDVVGRYLRDAPFEPVVIVPVDGVLESPTVVHELAHRMSREASLTQPGWLTEGLASYAETVRYDASTREVLFGAPNAGWLQVARLAPIQTIFDPGVTTQPSPNAFFTTSWALVHQMISTEPARFEGFQAALYQGSPWREAWDATLPPMDEIAIDQTLHSYVKQFRYDARRFPVEPTDVPLSKRRLEELEVRSNRALLYATSTNLTDAKRRVSDEVDSVLEVVPHDVGANLIAHYYSGRPPDPERARWLVQTVPDDWRVWVLLADAEERAGADPGVVLAALDEAIARAPERAYPRTRRGGVLRELGQHEEALAEVQRALRAEPTRVETVALYRVVLGELDRCDESRVAYERARAFFLLHGGSVRAKRLLETEPCP